MPSAVFMSFLEQQYQDGMALAAASDRFELEPLPARDGPPAQYLVHFRCPGLVVFPPEHVEPHHEFTVAVSFRERHLHAADPAVVEMRHPFNIWHPNILGPWICCGRLEKGTGLVDLIYQVYEMLIYQNFTPHHCLNPDAAQWARNHIGELPLDRSPLKRRRLELKVHQ
jgi:hypothetical protein